MFITHKTLRTQVKVIARFTSPSHACNILALATVTNETRMLDTQSSIIPNLYLGYSFKSLIEDEQI